MDYYRTQTEFNCGIDLHSRQMYSCVMDPAGEKLLHANIRNNDFDYFLRRVEPWRHDMTVVCESTFNWYWLADACCEAGIEFVLAHSLYLKHIHGGKNKNDRIDSEKLAHLLRANLIPPAYAYPAARRPTRALFRQRMRFVWKRSSLMGQLRMNQHAEGIKPAAGKTGSRDEWEANILDQYANPVHRFSAQMNMEMIRSYDRQIKLIERRLKNEARKDFAVELAIAKSAPGIAWILAMSILYEVDTIDRFPTVKDFLSYCRLVKGSVASAGKFKGLKGAKMGNAYLRWAFGQAAMVAKRSDPLIKAYADRLIARHGKYKGNAILAAKMARAVYFMLERKTVFDAGKLVSAKI